MNDEKTTVKELKQLFEAIRDERGWLQYHHPKSVTEALSVEAGELLELFLWMTPEEVEEKRKTDANYQQDIAYELADVLMNCLNLASIMDIDLSRTLEKKMEIVKEKYPVKNDDSSDSRQRRLSI